MERTSPKALYSIESFDFNREKYYLIQGPVLIRWNLLDHWTQERKPAGSYVKVLKEGGGDNWFF